MQLKVSDGLPDFAIPGRILRTGNVVAMRQQRMTGKRVEQFPPYCFNNFNHSPTKLSFYTACKTSFRRVYDLFRLIAEQCLDFALFFQFLFLIACKLRLPDSGQRGGVLSTLNTLAMENDCHHLLLKYLFNSCRNGHNQYRIFC